MSDLDNLVHSCERIAGYPTVELVQEQNQKLKAMVSELRTERKLLLNYIAAREDFQRLFKLHVWEQGS